MPCYSNRVETDCKNSHFHGKEWMHIILIDLPKRWITTENIVVPDTIKPKLTSDLWGRSRIAAADHDPCDEIIKLQRTDVLYHLTQLFIYLFICLFFWRGWFDFSMTGSSLSEPALKKRKKEKKKNNTALFGGKWLLWREAAQRF